MRHLIAFFALILLGSAASADTYDLSPEGNIRFLTAFAQKPGVVKLPDGLMYRVVHAGSGKGTSPISRLDIAVVEYKGWTIDGHVFDATAGEARKFPVGNLIPGWREALLKMKTGDEWQVVIPAHLGYGTDGKPPVIAPDQTLVFVLKLEEVDYP